MVQTLVAYQQQQIKWTANGNSKSPKKKAVSTVSTKSVSESMSNSDEEMYLDGSNTDIWEPPATLGTSHNRFAALMMEDSKRKKKKKQKSEPQPPKPPPSPKQPKTQSAHNHVKQFLKLGMQNFEQAQQTLLLFLVWGGIGEIPNGQAALLPAKDALEYPATTQGFQKLKQRYSILLSVVGTQWPGIVSSLLVHLVNCLLHHTDANPHKEYFLEAWILYLVSGEFVGLIHTLPKEMRTEAPAPWKYLHTMWYPLNGLCDQLQLQRSPNQTVQRLAKVFEEVLGDRRVSNYGLPQCYSSLHQSQPAESDNNFRRIGTGSSDQDGAADIDDSNMNNKSTVAVTDASNKMSLQAMEAMLFNDANADTKAEETETVDATEPNANGTAKSAENNPPQAIRTPWVRCTSWEPSAIGALPGCLQ